MAVRQQLQSLPVGTIVTDKEKDNKYIILEKNYNIGRGRASDGVLLGLYSRKNNSFFFENIVYDSDNALGSSYKNSEIRNSLKNNDVKFEISNRLFERLIPTMIYTGPLENETEPNLIGPDGIFLPSLSELSVTTEYDDGVPIPRLNTTVNLYLDNIVAENILVRYSKGIRVFTSNGTEMPIDTPASMVYFLCADPSINVGKDTGSDEYYLFEGIVISTDELKKQIDIASNLINKYKEVKDLKNALDTLQNAINLANQVIDSASDQVYIDEEIKNMKNAISSFEISILDYEIKQNKKNGNVQSISILISDIEDYKTVLSKDGDLFLPEISNQVKALDALLLTLNEKKNNIINNIEEIFTNAELIAYLNENYETFFNLQNEISDILIINKGVSFLRQELINLINSGQMLVVNYPLIDNAALQSALNLSAEIVNNTKVSNLILQNTINSLSQKITDFKNEKKFEIKDTSDIKIEIGSMGRQPTSKITMINNTNIEPIIHIDNDSIIDVSSPVVDSSILPLGSAKIYTISGIKAGTTNIKFTLNDNSFKTIGSNLNESITIPINVIEKDTVDPTFLDLVTDVSKVSIYQIDSGKIEFENLGDRIENLEDKIEKVEMPLDPSLISILNTTTPEPVINNVQNILIKDSDIVYDEPVKIKTTKPYFVGENNLLVYRNGVFQQEGVKYNELNNSEIIFKKNYLRVGDRLTLINSNIGDSEISKISVDYNENGTLNKILFYKNETLSKEISFIYDKNNNSKIIEQTIQDSIYKIKKIFTYNDKELVTDVNFSIETIGG